MKVKFCGNGYDSAVALEAYDIYKMQIAEQLKELKTILGAINV